MSDNNIYQLTREPTKWTLSNMDRFHAYYVVISQIRFVRVGELMLAKWLNGGSPLQQKKKELKLKILRIVKTNDTRSQYA